MEGRPPARRYRGEHDRRLNAGPRTADPRRAERETLWAGPELTNHA
jgi:hypothetical protein